MNIRNIYNAYDQGNYKEAVEIAQALANKGEADAQCCLAALYYEGVGVPRNYEEAERWWLRAAKAGSADAYGNLGVFYQKRKNYPEASKWLRLGVAQGNALCQYFLAHAYEKGLGVAQDYNEAARLFELAADQGDADAQCKLGYMYANGLGVSQDQVKAFGFFLQAASQGHVIATHSVGVAYANGWGVTRDHAHAQQWFREWFRLSESDGPTVPVGEKEVGQNAIQEVELLKRFIELKA